LTGRPKGTTTDPEWFDLAGEYGRVTAVIHMTRLMGGNYLKDEKKAREMLGRLRSMGFPQMEWLEAKLKWALEAPAGVSSHDYLRGRS
jgi:hypothetical protein